MPAFLRALVRVVVLLLMAAHVFYVYAFARALQEIVGHDFATVLASSSLALIMLAPLAWMVALPDLPSIIRAHRARRRWLQGRCPRCGSFVIQAVGGACPECGADRSAPVTCRVGWAAARRLAALALAVWLLGCIAAEGWASLDEAVFAREAEAHVSASRDLSYSRPRRWPMQDKTLYYTPTDGVTPYSPELILSD
jgi:hypothetical protein